MKISKVLTLTLIAMCACNKSPEYFIGKWQILTIVENNDTVDLVENWMHLKSDGTFESYDGELDKKESGKWTYQPKEKLLYIDGQGEEDSEWILSVENDTLFFHSKSDNLYLIAMK